MRQARHTAKRARHPPQEPPPSLQPDLAPPGFDVWMFNTRGNTFSHGHRTLRSTDQGYWEYSMDELALMDLPAQIDFVLKATGQPSLALIGHSQAGSVGYRGGGR